MFCLVSKLSSFLTVFGSIYYKSSLVLKYYVGKAEPPVRYKLVSEAGFKKDVYFHSKTQHTTVKYNQQLSKHSTTVPRLAIVTSHRKSNTRLP
jgi:hypothetical protein